MSTRSIPSSMLFTITECLRLLMNSHILSYVEIFVFWDKKSNLLSDFCFLTHNILSFHYGIKFTHFNDKQNRQYLSSKQQQYNNQSKIRKKHCNTQQHSKILTSTKVFLEKYINDNFICKWNQDKLIKVVTCALCRNEFNHQCWISMEHINHVCYMHCFTHLQICVFVLTLV